MNHGKTAQSGECERIVVKTSDGRVFDLGKPTALFFKLRLALYKWRRRHEIAAARRAQK